MSRVWKYLFAPARDNTIAENIVLLRESINSLVVGQNAIRSEMSSFIDSHRNVLAGLYNPYIKTMTHRSNKEVINLKRKFLEYCKIIEGGCCMVTGKSGSVILAHILPHSSSDKVREILGITDINDYRNLLLLSDGIERSFDKLQLGFVRELTDVNGLSTQYVMKIFNSACLNEPLFPNCSETIGDLFRNDKKPYLNLTIGNITHNPYNRCLSFQAMWAYYHNFHVYNFKFADYDSVEPNMKNKILKDVYLKQFNEDRAIEQEDEEDYNRVQETVLSYNNPSNTIINNDINIDNDSNDFNNINNVNNNINTSAYDII